MYAAHSALTHSSSASCERRATRAVRTAPTGGRARCVRALRSRARYGVCTRWCLTLLAWQSSL
eukprot:2925204-Pleurochrysis_carterae.AAC.1